MTYLVLYVSASIYAVKVKGFTSYWIPLDDLYLDRDRIDHKQQAKNSGRILFEVTGVSKELAMKAFTLAGHKLPIKTTTSVRPDFEENN